LSSRTNLLAFQGVENSGNRPSALRDAITVTNLGAPAPRPVLINEWMADNAGPGGFPQAGGTFSDWFELYNPNATPVDLSGYHLTDSLAEPAKWGVPTNTVIGGRGFLLVWADSQTNLNSSDVNGDLHADFQLKNSGEAIGLYAPDGTLQHAVVFGAQLQNISQGLFPDGATNQFNFMTNWTPRAANTLAGPLHLGITLNGAEVTLRWSAVPGRVYQVQFKDSLAAPQWTPLGEAVVPAGEIGSATDALPLNSPRFYRVWRSH
jgi:hypothetical protein